MSDLSYFRSEIDMSEFTTTNGISHYVLDSTSVNSSYFPRETDIITVSPKSGGANINCWVEWSTDHWRIYISDQSYSGKIHYRLKSRSY